jgi:DNA (cytosine-5)-methyltransferase 1
MSKLISIDTDNKNKLKKILLNIVKENFPEPEICLFLSGGADSILIGLIADELGKKINAISYELEGIQNWDCQKAERISNLKGWNFHKIIVPISNPKNDFTKLIQEFKCVKKTELEVLFPIIYMLKEVNKMDFKKILTGFGSPLPSSRVDMISWKKDSRKYWNDVIAKPIESTATSKVIEVAKVFNIDIKQPLRDIKVINILSQIDTNQIHKPYWKNVWKELYIKDFESADLLKKGPTPALQKGGGVHDYFAQLINDSEINYKNYNLGSKTLIMSQLVKLWSKDIPKSTPNNNQGLFNPYKLEDVYKQSNKRLFSVVSTFAGGGGSSTGYKLAGGHILFANEFIPEAVKTYNSNYPDTKVSDIEIRKVTRNKKVKEWFQIYGVNVGEYDILDGSPPCSTFSSAGKGKKKMEEKNVRYSDSKQDRLGMLIHDFVYIANVTKPKVVIMENVPNIKSSDVFKKAISQLSKYNYIVTYGILTSSNFNVPQRRRRLFVLGVRKDIADKVGIKDEKDLLTIYPKGSSYEPSIKDGIKDLKINSSEKDLLLSNNRRSMTHHLLKALPFNPSDSIKISDIDKSWKSDFNLVRSSWDHPCPTLTQMGQQMGRGGIFHPSENRVFTIAELKRLTGLPDDYVLTGSFNKKAERIGRMVPPLMTKALAESVYTNILSKI